MRPSRAVLRYALENCLSESRRGPVAVSMVRVVSHMSIKRSGEAIRTNSCNGEEKHTACPDLAYFAVGWAAWG
jgi:hypothetical protein